MNKAISRALWGAFFVGGLTVLGAGAAHAADTSGEDGIASGNQVGILGELPVTVGGNAISILGDSDGSGSSAAATGGSDSTGGNTTSGEDAIAGGNQVMPEVAAPVVVSGNAISILGDSTTDAESAGATDGRSTDGDAASTTGGDAIGSGNQVFPAVTAPVIVGGNDVSVIPDSTVGRSALDRQLLDDLLMINRVADGGMFGEPVATKSLIAEPFNAALLIERPLLAGIERGAFAPAAAGAVVGSDVPGVTSPDSGPTPLMATAAILPAMMLAATGVEALPLIGGIAVMLATGLGLVGLKRVTHAIS